MPRLPITDLPQSHVFSAPRLPAPTGSRAGGEAEENPAPAASNGHAVSAGGSPWVWCRILGQVGGLFVVMETEDGLVLMDPHAAHERILYERFLAEVKQGRVRSQGLLMPETAELPPAAAEQVRNNLDLLTDLGFGLSDLGGDTFIVDALPAIFGGFTVENMLRDAALATEQAGPRGSRERWSRDRIALAACKAAVKARDRLTLAEIEQLVRDLAVCEMPYTCPHGRPTLIHWSYQECRRQFGRT